jgi:hypothetical protein
MVRPGMASNTMLYESLLRILLSKVFDSCIEYVYKSLNEAAPHIIYCFFEKLGNPAKINPIAEMIPPMVPQGSASPVK